MPRAGRSNSLSTSRDEGSRRDSKVTTGRLYWLPAKAEHDIRLLQSTSMDDGCFAHPVIVLRVDKTRKNAEVFIVSEEIKTLIKTLLQTPPHQCLTFSSRSLPSAARVLHGTQTGECTYLFILPCTLTMLIRSSFTINSCLRRRAMYKQEPSIRLAARC